MVAASNETGKTYAYGSNYRRSTDWLGWWNYRINWLSARGMKECCGADVLGEVEEGLDTLRFAVATPIVVLRRPT
ncbi:hypothetical protein Moror_2698 [Moniliophthora roreri MCA 2997]|uniref:Uncharacterized protein n=1 Tax=Moniliophthora roreri (strain MCA 2997) TaxID=1381753 RepID=V2XFY3_MONRO|nr:hypothetical protein Moror_2698 [Moniliophthora roreri MCA 2997]